MRHLAILLTAGAIVLAGSCIVAADPHQAGIGPIDRHCSTMVTIPTLVRCKSLQEGISLNWS